MFNSIHKPFRLHPGSEMLRLQGLHPEEFDTQIIEPEKLLGDLAGNAFASTCVSAAVLALLGSLRYASDSEDEQLAEITHTFQAVGMINRLAQQEQ